MRSTSRRLLATLATVTVLGAVPVVASAGSVPVDAEGIGSCDWAMFRHDAHNTASISDDCTDIDLTTVSSLSPQVLYRTRDSVTSTPAIDQDNGIAYVAAWDGRLYAFDATAAGVGDQSFTDMGDANPIPTLLPLAERQIDDSNGVSFGRIVGSPTLLDIGEDQPAVIFGGGSTIHVWQLQTDPDTGEMSFVDVVEGLCLDPRTDADATDASDDGSDAGRCQGSGNDEVEVESSVIVVPAKDNSGDDADVWWLLVGNSVHNANDVGRTGMHALQLVRPAQGNADQPKDLELSVVWKFDPEGDVTGDRLSGGALDADSDGSGLPREHARVGRTLRAGDYASDYDLLTDGSGTGDGCGGVWGTAAVDVAADVVVFGTSSCGLDTGARDDLAGAMSLDATVDAGEPNRVAGEKVFAVSLSDGSFRWRFDPPRPFGSTTDDDFGTAAQLVDIDGSLVAAAAGKDGWLYAVPVDQSDLDTTTASAAPRWMSNFGQPGHANNNFAIGGALGSPALGEVLDPVTGEHRPAFFATTAISTPVGTPLDYGTPTSVDPTLVQPSPNDDSGDVVGAGRMLSLAAVDAGTGAVIWRQPLTRQTYAHPTYVHGELGGVVIVPSTVGFSVQAYSADTGALVWTSPVSGPPSSGVAVGERGIWLGVGTRQTDAGFKLTGTDSVFNPLYDGLDPLLSQVPGALNPGSDESLANDVVGADPQARVAGILAFRLAASALD